MNPVSDIILMTIAAANNLEVMTVDIGNVYINANTQEKINTRACAEFELVGIMAEEDLLEVIKAIYGLPTSGNRRHLQLSHTLREIIFIPARFDTNIWIRVHEGC